MYEDLNVFKNVLKQERTKRLPAPFNMVYKNFEKLGYHTKNESYFLSNASYIINNLRSENWNQFTKEEKKFSNHIYTMLIEDSVEKYSKMEVEKGIKSFTTEYTEHIYNLQLSNTQSRRARAGKEFEAIIELVLMGARIEFDTQSSVGSGVFETSELAKLVDCVVPGAIEYKLNKRNSSLISAKTTLRERWQEVGDEMSRTMAKEMYLVTLDEKISDNNLKLISKNNIIIVTTNEVKCNYYKNSPYVITFEQMLNELKTQNLQWKSFNYPVADLQFKMKLYQDLETKNSNKRFVSEYYKYLISTL
ncbi:restriction endonuclease [Staphylococcus epidermidis]|uniref:type II restriction endonuclease n=1 Tax=Staphylococcus epidermidis TaxID=1282 RepID=UPI001E566A6C|nr:type II restriction endonuclease [Staphylococcus epidermidis]MCD8886613.1 restriction endonuclease [Staphylococcus epidermidis]MCG2496111.1 restriction endonuclease [Staphylococcus epidermidis]MCG2518731.1 restriction endonuclease [Staphylococcus epidermidis]